MVQAQKRPPEREETESIIQSLRELVQRIRSVQFTPEQREQIRQFLEEMARRTQQTSTQPSSPVETAPQSRRQPAPRRVEQFVYDISLGGRTYRVALAEPLPTLRGGGVNLADAQRRLHDLLLNNQLVTHANPSDPASPVVALAQVTMPGSSQAEQRFNAGTPNQRLDLFRDAYLNLTFRNGRYVESTAVRITEVPQEGSTRRL
ncbi:MAG: hypothetical protein V1861_04105 [Candidatus Micrarchaeota archaeon]